MERIPEPQLMDDDEQASAYSEADFAAPHDRFVELLLRSWPAARGPLRGPVLDLGCGPADILVRLARACPEVVLHGVDGSEAMLRHGRDRVARAGLQDRITLERAILPEDAPPLFRYPVVTSNSLLHHLHDPSVMWASVGRYGAAGAHVFVMDLMRPGTRADAARLVEIYSAGEPAVLRRDFEASLCAAFTTAEVRAQLDAAGLSQLRVEAVSDRHLTVTGVLA